MTSKINKEESISRVYQFLNSYKGDWKADADRNGDNVIIKSEFGTFLKKANFDFNFNGVTVSENDKQDIIKAFWDTIDIEKTGKLNSGRNISDKGALNANELNMASNNIKATDIVNKFMNNKTMPKSIDSKWGTRWRNSVKSGMINRAIAFLKDNKKELSEEEINKILSSEVLDGFYKSSAIKATADYKAREWLDTLKNQYGNIGYTVDDDKVIDSIINEYINQLGDSDKSLEEICKDVESIMQAYIDTAKTNSQESISKLTQYGYDPSTLNPLQRVMLKTEFKSKLMETIESKNVEVYNNYKDALDSGATSYIENIIGSVNDFNQIKSNMDSYIDSFMKTEFDKLEKEYNKLVNDRADFITKVWEEFVKTPHTSERLEAIKQVFGTNDKDEVAKVIQGYDRATLDAKKAEFEKVIKAIDKKLPDDFLNGISDITVALYENKKISLPNQYVPAYTTGHLHYSVQNGEGVISVTELGEVTIRGSVQNAKYTPTILVKDDEGNIVAQKTITITVAGYNLSYNGKSLSELLANDDYIKGETWGSDNIDTAKTRTKENIKTACEQIANTLKAYGYPADKVDIALAGVISYFNAIIDKCWYGYWGNYDQGYENIEITYQFNGKTERTYTDFFHYSRYYDTDAGEGMLQLSKDGKLKPTENHSGVGLWTGYNTHCGRENSYGFYVSSAALLMKFEEFLSRL